MAQGTEYLISAPSVTVNNISFATASDSVSFIEGRGTRTLTGTSAGGNAVIPNIAIDISEAFGVIKFTVLSNIDNIEEMKKLNQNDQVGLLTVELTGLDNITGKSFTRSMSNGTIMNNPETKLGPGGTIDIEIHGRTLV